MKLQKMNSEERKDWIETFVGGAFGVVAIIAAIVEYSLGDNGAIAGMFKDIFGTLVVVVLLFAAMPKKTKANFEEKLTSELESWINSHSNMIVKTSKMPQGHENDFGMSMTTDINRFYETAKLTSDAGKGVGRFLRITQINRELYAANNVKLEFFVNAQTYCSPDATPEEATKELLQVGENLSKYIVGVVRGVNHEKPHKLDARTVAIPLSFNEPIVTESGSNTDLLINVIDRMYEAMLVSARRK